MFALKSIEDNSNDLVVDVEYYTESKTFMKIFDVLSDEVLQEIPNQDAYLNGDPAYDDRYLSKYTFDRSSCDEMITEGSLIFDSKSGTFSIEKEVNGEPRVFNYDFRGGRFGLLSTDKISKFEREYTQYKHGWLTAKRIYRHLVNDRGQYEETKDEIRISDQNVKKGEDTTNHGHVIFAKHDDEGEITHEFADRIIRAIAGKNQYRLYFASHQDVPEHDSLQFDSEDHTLTFSNIDSTSVEDKAVELRTLYNQATNDDLSRRRQYITAGGLLAGISEISDDVAAKSLDSVVSRSSYGVLKGFVKQKLKSANSPEAFRGSLNKYFDTVGTEIEPATLVNDGFDYESFYRLVEMVDDAGRTLEMSAGDFSDLDEEGYRSVVTGMVDQRIDGNLTREAETGRGPSDIRLRDNDGNVIYIGECKYWTQNNSGAEANVKKPLKQLDTYDQNEKFNSIIVFFKSDDYAQLDSNGVLSQAAEKLTDYDVTYSINDEMFETSRSCVYKHLPNDDGEEHFLSLHVFDVGAEQYHESEATKEEATV